MIIKAKDKSVYRVFAVRDGLVEIQAPDSLIYLDPDAAEQVALAIIRAAGTARESGD